MLRDQYELAQLGNDAAIKNMGWVKIMERAEHRGAAAGESFHARLDRWKMNENGIGIFSKEGLPLIRTIVDEQQALKYPTGASVLDEYIDFLDFYLEYREMIPVVKAFAKVYDIPITR